MIFIDTPCINDIKNFNIYITRTNVMQLGSMFIITAILLYMFRTLFASIFRST